MRFERGEEGRRGGGEEGRVCASGLQAVACLCPLSPLAA